MPGKAWWKEYRASELESSDEWVYMLSFDERDVVLVLIDFLKWLIEVKELPASVACHQLTGVRDDFRCHVSSEAPFKHYSLVAAKKSWRALSREDIINRTVTFEKQPIVGTMIITLRVHYYHDAATLDQRMTYMGIVTAFNIALRPCELALDGSFFRKCKVTGELIRKKQDHRFFLVDIYLETDMGVALTSLQYVSTPLPRPRIDYMGWDTPS